MSYKKVERLKRLVNNKSTFKLFDSQNDSKEFTKFESFQGVNSIKAPKEFKVALGNRVTTLTQGKLCSLVLETFTSFLPMRFCTLALVPERMTGILTARHRFRRILM